MVCLMHSMPTSFCWYVCEFIKHSCNSLVHTCTFGMRPSLPAVLLSQSFAAHGVQLLGHWPPNQSLLAGPKAYTFLLIDRV